MTAKTEDKIPSNNPIKKMYFLIILLFLSDLCGLLERCAHDGEGNSVLVVEPTGCCRARFVRESIEKSDLRGAKVIWLDGWFWYIADAFL